MRGRARPLQRSILPTVLALTLAAPSLAPQPTTAATDQPASAYITPTCAGRRDGSNWQNAGALVSLPVLMGRVGPGGRVLTSARRRRTPRTRDPPLQHDVRRRRW